MKKALLLNLAIPLLLLPSLATSEEAQRSDVLQTTERIRSEERRQGDVRRQLSGSVRKIDRLLKDLESNGLTEEGQGQVVGEMSVALTKVNATRVPQAAQDLQKARLEIDDAFPHLDEAEQEIKAIIIDLDDLLKASETALLADVLLEQIRALIKRESFLRRETARWGKMIFINEGAATADKPRMVRAQSETLLELEQFARLLEGAAEKATDESLARRFKGASEVLQERKPDTSLRSALATIEQEDSIAAVKHQDKAIEALKEIEKVLSSDEDELASKEDVLEELKRILEEQVDLKEEVEDAGKELKNASELQAEQLELQKDLEKAVAGEPPSEALEEASDAMEEAAEELAEGDQEGALPPQETAINELQNAISQLESEIAEAAEAADAFADSQELSDSFADPSDSFAEPSDSFAEPSDSFADPSDSFGDSFADGSPSDGFPSDGFPSDAGTGPLGAGPPGAGPPGTGPPGPGAPGIGPPSSVPSSGVPVPGSFSPAPPGVLPDDPQIDSTGYSSTTVRGNQVKRTRMSMNSLERRRRAAAIQKYVQQLPPEFRKQVADYYEVLAE
jgi:hypothetical protein